MMLISTLIFTILIFLETVKGAKVAMKVVEAPVSYGLNNDLIGTNFRDESLSLLVPPSKFSGPEHLKSLLDRCYNFVNNNYNYSFCPFQNITQYELTNRWNSYHGVLGVWQEWKIINNTFSSMMMLKGEKCGDIHRSVEVILACNDTEGIQQVVEPAKCNYVLIFTTPLVCHPDALLVYPCLPNNLRKKWDQLETDFNLQFITSAGYENALQNIFIEAGYQQVKDIKPESKITQNNVTSTGSFANLNSCIKEVLELRNEIEGLKILLDLKNVRNTKK